MARRIVMVAVPDAQILDVAGPLEVFSQANRELVRRGRVSPAELAYRTVLAAGARGPLPTSSGVALLAQRSLAQLRGPIDTLAVAGGNGVDAALSDGALLRRLKTLASRSRRVASVCTGAFLLAEAGLLDGCRVTTHWGACQRLQARYPALEVDPDPIFVRDGRVITSAGVTAGMDLALALVEEDHGRDLALMVARRLVLFLKRPGGQSQFSAVLEAQEARRGGSDPLGGVLDWIAEHPGDDLSVAVLARRAALSPRHFARVFAQQTGSTPARFVERARVQAARRLLEETRDGVDAIAADCGFGSAETLRRSFLRTLRVGPAEYRNRFQGAGSVRRREVTA